MQISNLPASNSFSSTDVLPIEINGVTYKVTGATLAAALQTFGGYLTTENVANNLTTTAAGSVLDARQGKMLNDKINATQSDIAIIIEGNQTTHTGGVAVGEFVSVRNSTISGIADGLYKATQAIPANTAIDSTYLTAVNGGGLNEVNVQIGTANGGTYFKFGSGLLINIKKVGFSNIPCSTTWGSLYESSEYSLNLWPYPFKDDDVFNCTALVTGSSAIIERVSDQSKTSCGKIIFCRPTSASVSPTVHLIAIGLWK